LAEVGRLTPETYMPRAYTPLIDACVKMVKATEETVARRPDKPRVIVVFQIDGEENASHEYRLDELRSLIERRKAEGWQFVFLGANIDAYAAARDLGVLEEATLAYTGERTWHSMVTLAELSVRFVRGRSERVKFSGKQKCAAGDRRGVMVNQPIDPASRSTPK
jgi:hypothetical protein